MIYLSVITEERSLLVAIVNQLELQLTQAARLDSGQKRTLDTEIGALKACVLSETEAR